MNTKLNYIPSHYRRLGDDELVKPSDLACAFGHQVNGIERVGEYPVQGLTPGNNPSWVYYRRRHVAVDPNTIFKNQIKHRYPWKKIVVSKNKNAIVVNYPGGKVMPQSPVENKPLVSFIYPHDNGHRAYLVRLIGVNSKYFVGLDVHRNNQFKKFLKNKAGAFRVEEFNPSAIK